MFSTGGFPTALATAASPAAILHPVALQSDSTYKPNPCRPSWLAGERHCGMVWMLQRALEQGNKAAGLTLGVSIITRSRQTSCQAMFSLPAHLEGA